MTSDTTPMSWIDRAEAAMRGEAAPDAELYPGQSAPLFTPRARSAMLAPFIASFLWAGVVFREQQTHPLDPIALLLRALALAFSARAVVLWVQLLREWRVSFAHARYALALTDEGLLLRTPQADYALAKEDIVDVRQRGAWQERRDPSAEVYVVTRPRSGRSHLALPPLFASSPGVLAEHLMRWRGAVQAATEQPARTPADLPSKLLDAVAGGERPEGVAVIAQSRTAGLRRAPFATILLGVTVLDGLVRLPSALRSRAASSAGLVIALCLGVVPIAFWLFERRRVAPQKGIALLLTPAELLWRSRAGAHRLKWSDVARVDVSSRRGWSIVRGPYEARALVLQLKDGSSVQHDEAGFAAPAEVAAALCDGYRKNWLP
jgi:hypothetical protein